MDEGEVLEDRAPRISDSGGTPMLSDEQWGAIRSLAGRGMGTKAIARQLGLDPKTVRKYLRRGGREPYRRRCPVQEALERDHGAYLEARAAAVGWCARVLLQELQGRGYTGGYDAVKRWVAPRREAQRCLEEATVRFETAPTPSQGRVDLDGTRVALEQLGLIHTAETLPQLVSDAVKENLAVHRFLDKLLGAELARREERRIRTSLLLSGLPPGQTLGNFGWSFQPGIEKPQVETLATCAWIREHATVLIQGPPGTGKTHLAVALGVKAVEHSFSVAFFRPAVS